MSIRHFKWQTTVTDEPDSTAAVWWFLNAGWSTRGNHESQIVWIVTWMKKAGIWVWETPSVETPCNWIPYSSLRYGECWKIACDESMIEARHFGIVTCFNTAPKANIACHETFWMFGLEKYLRLWCDDVWCRFGVQQSRPWRSGIKLKRLNMCGKPADMNTMTNL